MDLNSIKKSYRFYAPFYNYIFGDIVNHGRKQAIQCLRQTPGDRILEIGVGTGLSISLYAPHVRVTGIDISPDMLARARRKYPQKQYPQVVEFREMDAQQMEFADNSFDCAAAMYVASVVPDPQAMLREISRVCVDGATVLILNHFSSERGFFRWLEKSAARFSSRLGFRPDFDLNSFLEMTGMEITQITPVNIGGYWTLIELINRPCARKEVVNDNPAVINGHPVPQPHPAYNAHENARR